MDKYKELIAVFSDVLEKSKDYHISYIYQVGYVSLVGLLGKEEKQNVSMVVAEIQARGNLYKIKESVEWINIKN